MPSHLTCYRRIEMRTSFSDVTQRVLKTMVNLICNVVAYTRTTFPSLMTYTASFVLKLKYKMETLQTTYLYGLYVGFGI